MVTEVAFKKFVDRPSYLTVLSIAMREFGATQVAACLRSASLVPLYYHATINPLQKYQDVLCTPPMPKTTFCGGAYVHDRGVSNRVSYTE